MKALALAVLLLVYQPCSSRSVTDEESVVSVYTTLPSTAGTGPGAPRDVYQQIAVNIAERITEPIYRFFGFDNSSTKEHTTTKRPFEHIELGTPDVTHPSDKNDSKKSSNETESANEIPDRDVEELSVESLQKTDRKPEKFTLFSSYLPVKSNFELINDTSTEKNDNNIDSDDNSLELDDVDVNVNDAESGREGPFVFVLELIGSIIQLLWGGFLAIFKPASER